MMKNSILFFLVVLISACGGEVAIPKPHVYPKVYYPKKDYEGIKEELPFSFQKPVYTILSVSRDARQENNPNAKHWRNLEFNDFNATLHLSYAKLKNMMQLDSLKEEARRLTYEHAFKADDIQNIAYNNELDKVYGTIFLIEGNTATNLNFYLTDSSNHFFRGSLYFNSKTKPDSILPVFTFIKQDVEHLINTFKWKPLKK